MDQIFWKVDTKAERSICWHNNMCNGKCPKEGTGVINYHHNIEVVWYRSRNRMSEDDDVTCGPSNPHHDVRGR